ncbi:hypothetical protein HAZT_HAZT001715 [Hyalella azteca]|uniref:Chitin deacetylase 7 n=1 Tax=Hyalella azteca TaxID=294128 RepID=A0A6A0H0B3_HYAAZ|nr:chitin deacetylase 7 [Hyalella azteca]KAA0194972.1 hypothetical protein HAZT_HAZT001715 [Hyalella azteca]
MLREAVAAAALLLLSAAVFNKVGPVQGEAPACNQTELPCNNATCRCSSTDVPGGFELKNTPQFVVLSFDDAVTVSNFPFYEKLSKNVNPNGCEIKMTFFVCHESLDYTLVHKLYRMGHEISTHSVSHKSDVVNYWRNMTKEMWTNEITDMKTMLINYGKIPADEIVGFRVPFLEVGGNLMYEVLLENGFKYDCSWPSLKYTPWYTEFGGEPLGTLWPYTLDYMSIQDQTVGTKPTDSFPNMWVNPMTDMQDNRGVECPMLDQCVSAEDELETSAEAVLDLLRRNFNTHFYGDRAPFGLYTHHSWFLTDTLNNVTVRHDGFQMFLDYLKSFPQVYIVNVHQLIQWVQNPVDVANIAEFGPLQCGNMLPDMCAEADNINCVYNESLPIDQSQVYMKICEGPCPAAYPWTGNPDGVKGMANFTPEKIRKI